MKRFILKGLTTEARESLSEFDLEDLEDMIGDMVFESDEISKVDRSLLILMSDGNTAHKDFLELEEITAPLKPKQ